jgi:hypothetical protein
MATRWTWFSIVPNGWLWYWQCWTIGPDIWLFSITVSAEEVRYNMTTVRIKPGSGRDWGTPRMCVGSEVLTAVVMKSTIFWDITPCTPSKAKPTFRRNMSPPSSVSKNKPSSLLLSRWFLARLILRPWRWRRQVPLKRRLTFNGLQGVISQKRGVFNVNEIVRLMPPPDKGSITLRLFYHSTHWTGQSWRFTVWIL